MKSVTRKKANGVFYTPVPVVQHIVKKTLQPLLLEQRDISDLSVLDPACGDGAFLQEVIHYLSRVKPVSGDRQSTLSSLYGVDIDANAVRLARQRLTNVSGPSTPASETLIQNLRQGDALLEPESLEEDSVLLNSQAFSWRSSFPQVFERDVPGFDAIVGNPPYVNIRVLTRTRGAEAKDYYRGRYKCAARAYDLYVLFLERAFELLRPGGICGMIVPNKIATMEYAAPCRELLAKKASLLHVADLSQLGAFPRVGVYPYVLIWKKQPAPENHFVSILHARTLDDLKNQQLAVSRRQDEVQCRDGIDLHSTLDVEDRSSTAPLVQLARLNGGTAGFAAQRVGGELREWHAGLDGRFADFIVSGNVDRFRIKCGGVRYMKQNYQRPVLHLPNKVVSETKTRLFRSHKIVLAGMSKRLEAALDVDGLALGVQVYAVWQSGYDLRYLLGIINSKLMSFLFRSRYSAKQLSHGYLSVNKGQLEKLPIRQIDFENSQDVASHDELVSIVDQMTLEAGSRFESLDRRLDRIVYGLYNLDSSEIDRVEHSSRQTI